MAASSLSVCLFLRIMNNLFPISQSHLMPEPFPVPVFCWFHIYTSPLTPTVYLKWPSELSTSSHQTAPCFPLFHDSSVSDKHFHFNRKSYFAKSNASLHFTGDRVTVPGATWSCKNSDQSCWSLCRPSWFNF